MSISIAEKKAPDQGKKMSTRHSTGIFTQIAFLAVINACTVVLPDDLKDMDESSSGDVPGGTGSPTEGDGTGAETSAPDEETSGGSGEGGEAPVVCNPADNYEPNDIEDESKTLPNITDEDEAGGTFKSILAGEADIDWFAYMGTDVAFAYVDPFSGIDAHMELRLCLFVECVNGPTQPFNCLDSVYEESPDLVLPGCCNFGGSTFVSIDLFCNAGDDDSAYVFMRVDQGNADMCVPYEITYHF